MGPWANLSYPVYRFTYLTTASEFAWLCLSRISWLESESLLFLLIFFVKFVLFIIFFWEFDYFWLSIFSCVCIFLAGFNPIISLLYTHDEDRSRVRVFGFWTARCEWDGSFDPIFLYFYPFPISLCVSFSHCDPLPILHPRTISLTRSPACVRISLVFVLFWLYCWPVSIPLISFLLWLFIIFLSYSFSLLIFELIV